MSFLNPVHDFYARFERPISSFSLILGFIFDAFTLKRADTLFENLWILGYLLIIGIFIILIHRKENRTGEPNSSSAHFWYVNILQFAFGGVFSAYLILYFRSADIFVAWPFIALLALIFIGNEFFKKHYVRLSFQISLYFLSIYWFMIFLVPVVLHKLGTPIFLLSGAISLGLIALFIKLLFYSIKDKFTQSKRLIVILISGVLLLVNFLYFTNLIPPIPLSLKEADLFYSVRKNAEGDYVVTYEKHGWIGFFNFYPSFKSMPGGKVYAWSSVYSPKYLNLAILHEWQYYNEEKGIWETRGTTKLPLIGGREAGFRTFSFRSGLEPGKWRVNVKTESGQIIGRLRSNIVWVAENPNLEVKIK